MTTNPPPKPDTPPAVAALYIHGRPTLDNWPDYISKHTLTAEHIPTLIDIITDKTLLYFADGSAADVVIHAYRALGQLQAAEALPAMVGLYAYEEDDILGIFFTEDLPKAIEIMGEAGLPYLYDLLPRRESGYWGQAIVTDAISKIGLEYGKHRADCIEVLATQLQLYQSQDPDFNSDLVLALCRMKATETIDLVKRVYTADCVNTFAIGDWENVQIEMGRP